ncbi:MAG TPA: hypothetical protein VFQ25_09485 [Ktedonobacterales bacterium]|nr:hypothetical protein [Ktedonobacterales bacterium]
MTANTTTDTCATTPGGGHPPQRSPRLAWLARGREALIAAGLFLLAFALRLGLAAHGWPYLNSDEATIGLMSVDIWRSGARPIFSYGQNYIGALQAYLAAPFFALLNGDPLALRLATLLQTMLFLLVMYALARRIFNPGIALFTLALLALGSDYALKHELQAGAGAQDTLLFGALVVWLSVLRLRGGWKPGARLALDAGLGLAVGLGLWGDFLFLPYVFAAALALGYTAVRALYAARRKRRAWPAFGWLALDVAVLAGMAVVGAAPLLSANIASGGATLQNVAHIAGTPGSNSWVGAVGALGKQLAKQIGATALVGLPNALGSELVCHGCAIWPAQRSVVTVSQAARAVAISAPFTLVAVGLWLASALPLARDARRALAHAMRAPFPRWQGRLLALPTPDARWWGRFMLVTGSALTLLQYMASAASYTFPTFTNRYLIGVYIAAPLVVAPLYGALASVWRAGRAHPTPGWRAVTGTALLALILGLSGAGAAHCAALAGDTTMYGDPISARDARLVAFLQTHRATSFYTGYWTCGRLILASQERLNCSVVSEHDAFTPGFNRYPPAVRAVAESAHPAWVFNMRALDVDASVPQQVAACVRSGAPRCAGYASATVEGYLIYYYTG